MYPPRNSANPALTASRLPHLQQRKSSCAITWNSVQSEPASSPRFFPSSIPEINYELSPRATLPPAPLFVNYPSGARSAKYSSLIAASPLFPLTFQSLRNVAPDSAIHLQNQFATKSPSANSLRRRGVRNLVYRSRPLRGQAATLRRNSPLARLSLPRFSKYPHLAGLFPDDRPPPPCSKHENSLGSRVLLSSIYLDSSPLISHIDFVCRSAFRPSPAMTTPRLRRPPRARHSCHQRAVDPPPPSGLQRSNSPLATSNRFSNQSSPP